MPSIKMILMKILLSVAVSFLLVDFVLHPHPPDFLVVIWESRVFVMVTLDLSLPVRTTGKTF
jgi:hypothetical protein